MFNAFSFLFVNLLNESVTRIEWVSQKDVLQAWEVFPGYRDKRWSFTDCVSRTVMRRLAVQTAFSFDDHFHQFGSVAVVP